MQDHPTNLPSVDAPAALVLEALYRALGDGEERTFEHAPFMPLSVSRPSTAVLRVSHTTVHDGDLLADPEIEFFRAAPGVFHPIQMREDPFARYRTVAELSDLDDRIARANAVEMAEIADFAAMWMRNVRAQFPEIEKLVRAFEVSAWRT